LPVFAFAQIRHQHHLTALQGLAQRVALPEQGFRVDIGGNVAQGRGQAQAAGGRLGHQHHIHIHLPQRILGQAVQHFLAAGLLADSFADLQPGLDAVRTLVELGDRQGAFQVGVQHPGQVALGGFGR